MASLTPVNRQYANFISTLPIEANPFPLSLKERNQQWIQFFNDLSYQVPNLKRSAKEVYLEFRTPCEEIDDEVFNFVFPIAEGEGSGYPEVNSELITVFHDTYSSYKDNPQFPVIKARFLQMLYITLSLSGFKPGEADTCEIALARAPEEIQPPSYDLLWFTERFYDEFERYTRILKCLTALQLNDHAKAFYLALNALKESTYNRQTITSTDLDHWLGALSPEIQYQLQRALDADVDLSETDSTVTFSETDNWSSESDNDSE